MQVLRLFLFNIRYAVPRFALLHRKKKGLELLGLAVSKKGNGECVGSFRISSRVVLFVSSEKECVCC